jgi:hypothetical protein
MTRSFGVLLILILLVFLLSVCETKAVVSTATRSQTPNTIRSEGLTVQNKENNLLKGRDEVVLKKRFVSVTL